MKVSSYIQIRAGEENHIMALSGPYDCYEPFWLYSCVEKASQRERQSCYGVGLTREAPSDGPVITLWHVSYTQKAHKKKHIV